MCFLCLNYFTKYNIFKVQPCCSKFQYFISLCFQSLSHVQLFCDPMNRSPPNSFVHGIFQARILKWVAISFSRGSALPRDQTAPPTLASGFFTTEPPGNLERMLINFKKNPQNFPQLSSRILTPRVKLKVLKLKF